MHTRKEYMEHRCTFAEYYGEIVKEAGISYAESALLPRIKAALRNGDEHLNTIPHRLWDIRAAQTRHILTPIFKARGDGYSMAGGVCVHKEAARIAAERIV
jgi:hypothetical protein